MTLVWLLGIFVIDVRGDFPLNDDWQYAYAVKSLVENGTLEYRGLFSPIILIQVLWGALFCKIAGGVFSFTVLRWSTLALVPLMTLIILRLGRSINITRNNLWILACMVYFTPLVMALSPSFMTDVPFAFLAIAAVMCYWKFTENRRIRWFALALILSVLAFYIRQPGLVLPVAFGLHYVITNSGGKRFAVLLGTLIFSIVLYTSWEYGLKYQLQLEDNLKSDSTRFLSELWESPLVFLKTMGLRFVKSVTYLGFFCAALLPFIWRHKLKKNQVYGALFLSAVIVVIGHMADKVFPFGGNIFYNFGLGPELLTDTYTYGLANTPQLPGFVMDVLNVISLFSAFIIALQIRFSWKQWEPNCRSYLVLWACLVLLYLPLMSITSYYDRYILMPLLLLLPLIAGLVDGKKHWVKWIPMTAMVLFSIAGTHDYMAWNRAKLTAFTALQEQGISIERIDAGYELTGWHNYGRPAPAHADTSFWWVTDDEYMLTFGPVSGYDVIQTTSYKRWLWFRTDYIHTLHRKSESK